MKKVNLASLFMLFVLIAGSAGATTYVTMADHHLAGQSELIVTGEIVGSRVESGVRKIWTVYDVAVDHVLKGRLGGSVVKLKVLGGIDREKGIGLEIFGAAKFYRGERVLLFLRQAADSSFRILHLQQGAFHERGSDGQRFFRRSMIELFDSKLRSEPETEVVPASPASPASDIELVRDREAFVSWLRDGDFIRPALASYLMVRPEARTSGFVAEPFTLLGGNNQVLRWYNWDPPAGDGLPRSKKVKWKRHRRGQPGLTGGGKKEVNKALKEWNKNKSMTKINYGKRGTTSSTTVFDDFDGQNTIYFSDINNDINDPYSCTFGGTLAIGGVSFIFDVLGLVWKGIPALPIAETEIVMNDGLQCPEFTALIFQMIYTHELGHTLGIGHTCDDSSSPNCSAFSFLSDSIMAAFINTDRPNSKISTEDKKAARFLYDFNFFLVPCNRKPGAGNFCKKCGPCGEGQGNCKNNGQCNGSLVCVTNTDPDVPGNNVCMPPSTESLLGLSN